MAKDPALMRSANETRLSFEAPIYEMEARLGEMEVQYAKNRTGGDHDQDRRADPPASPRAGRAQARDLFEPRPLANRSGVAAPAAPANPRLSRA